jgi:hypothetical protein
MDSGASPLSRHGLIKPLTFPWNVIKVIPPGSPISTEVTGINNLTPPQIVGDYVISVKKGASNCGSEMIPNYRSFYATVPSTGTSIPSTSFEDASYPDTKDKTCLYGTQMNAINNSLSALGVPVLVGVVGSPGDQGGNWAVVFNQGLWSLTNNPGTDKGTVGDGYLYGINNQDIAVGYHTKNATCSITCSQVAYYVAPPERYADIMFPVTIAESTALAIAYGINNHGDMVGTVDVSSGWESWYALCKSNSCPTGSGSGSGFNPASYCWGVLNNGSSTFRTTAYAITDEAILGGGATSEVAGSYTDGSGITHGFLVSVSRTSAGKCLGGTSSEKFEKIDEPDAHSLTVVRGVNDVGDIVGYYNDSSNNMHGFVGTPTGGAVKRRHLHR